MKPGVATFHQATTDEELKIHRIYHKGKIAKEKNSFVSNIAKVIIIGSLLCEDAWHHYGQQLNVHPEHYFLKEKI